MLLFSKRAARCAAALCIAAFAAGCAAYTERDGSVRAVASAPVQPIEAVLPGPAIPGPLAGGLEPRSIAAQDLDWRQYFSSIQQGAILVRLDARELTFWEPGGGRTHTFPIAIPRGEDLERTGLTKIVRRRKNPSWSPTPSMLAKNPNIPRYIGPGPHNPLGERALYLGWRYYAIHGTNDPYSIGSRATAGCFRLFPEDIEWLYDAAPNGTLVRVVRSTNDVDLRVGRSQLVSSAPVPTAN